MPVLPKPKFGHGGPLSCTVHGRSLTEKIEGWNDYRNSSISL